MGRAANPGGDLLDDLLTSCAGTLMTLAFTIYIKLATNSASWYYISLVLGRERHHCSRKTNLRAKAIFKEVVIPINDRDIAF